MKPKPTLDTFLWTYLRVTVVLGALQLVYIYLIQ